MLPSISDGLPQRLHSARGSFAAALRRARTRLPLTNPHKSMPGLRDDGPTYRGSLWSRTGSPVWQSVFCKLHKQQLVVFESESAEQAGTPLQTLELQDGQVAEISLKSAGRQMYERALRLKAFTQREEGSSDESSETPSPPASEHILAAEDGITHAAWHSELLVCAASAVSFGFHDASRLSDQFVLCSAGHLLRAVAGCSVAEPLSDKAVSASQQRKRAQATSLFGELGSNPCA